MVRALLDGSKTQTRRVAKINRIDAHPQNSKIQIATIQGKGEQFWMNSQPDHRNHISKACPYGQVGDQLWVRETFNRTNPHGKDGHYFYRADEAHEFPDAIWKPSIFMPRDASRITLEITGARVERLQAISDSDCKAEGIQVETSYDFAFSHIDREHHHELLQGSYASLWESLNGAGSWDLNPWVWVIEFKKVKP
jgi:hypothetical protein